MRPRYTVPALADLAAVLDYLAEQSPKGANRVQARIHSIIGLLPTSCGSEAHRRPDVRRLTTSPYPYLVFYEISEDEIIVHAVRHAARDPSEPIIR